MRSHWRDNGVAPIGSRGLSLVELLVGMTLGLMLIAILISVYLGVKQSYQVQDALARMQENARLALRLITYDVRMAGARGDVAQAWTISESLTQPLGGIGGECHAGWARTLTLPSDGNITPALTGTNGTRDAFTGCIDAAAHIAGTDVVSLHYAAADPLDDKAIEKGKAYLRGTLHGGLLFKASADKTPPSDFAFPGTARNYRLVAVAYYVRPWSAIAPTKKNPRGDGIPTLVRATLGDCGSSACVKNEAMVEGIADLQVQYGIDHADGSGVHDYVNADALGDFISASGKAQWRQVAALRIGLLARSLNTEPGYTDPNAPYHLGDQTINVTAGYRHVWITSVVARRNGHE